MAQPPPSPPPRRKPGLQATFLLGLAVILLCFSGLAAGLIYQHEKKNLEEDIFRQTDLMLAAAAATRHYVQETLRPRMFETLGKDVFLLEAMSSSFVSRETMEQFGRSLPGFTYRRVAINARNPRFEADPFEASVIRRFAASPQEQNWQTMRELDGTRHFVRFQPVRYDAPCLACHGEPTAAPPGIVTRYGDRRGFHQKAGSIAGLVSVSVPVDIGLAQVRETAFSVFSTLFLTVFFLYGIICFFFNRVIIQNLRSVLVLFRHGLADEKGSELFERARRQDEIGELNQVAGLMADHLEENRHRLQDYADNLEEKVEERTRLLEESQKRLHSQIDARNRELHWFNSIAELTAQANRIDDILPQMLCQTLEIVAAQGAAIYRLDREARRLELLAMENAAGLPDFIGLDDRSGAGEPEADCPMRQAACGRMHFCRAADRTTLYVPLCCRDRVLGVAAFTGATVGETEEQTKELLFSVGRQIGISLEALESLGALRRSREVLQSVVDGITDMIVLLDGDCRVRMANTACGLQANLSPKELIGRPVADLPLSPNPFVLCSSVLRRRPEQAVLELFHGDHGEIFEVHFFPVNGPDGRVERLVCYAKEVSEQRRVESRIQQTEKLLALGQLAAGVAHEINNPLGVILCHTDILQEELAENESARQDVRTIERHARTCQKIVADLLNFARSRKARRSPTEINRLLEESLAMLATHLRHGSFRLDLELAADLPVLEVDPDRLRQVFVNIAMNAVQAGGESGGELRVKSSLAENGKTVIIMEDNGEGIDEAALPRIFDPFFTTKEPGQGTGLGLSISHAIVHEHGGSLRAENTPEGWTRFTIELPAPAAGLGNAPK